MPSCALPVGFADKCAADESQAAPPQPRLLPWVRSLLSAVRATAQTTHTGRNLLVQLSSEPCQLGLLSRAPCCKRKLSRLFAYFSNFELGTVGREAVQKTKRFFFLLNCLKRQGCWNVRRGMTLRKREKSGCCFTTSFLVFTLIYSDNFPQASVAIWNEAAEGGTADRACCSLWVSPCRW